MPVAAQRPRLVQLSVLIVAALAIAGCSGSETAPGTNPTPGSGTAEDAIFVEEALAGLSPAEILPTTEEFATYRQDGGWSIAAENLPANPDGSFLVKPEPAEGGEVTAGADCYRILIDRSHFDDIVEAGAADIRDSGGSANFVLLLRMADVSAAEEALAWMKSASDTCSLNQGTSLDVEPAVFPIGDAFGFIPAGDPAGSVVGYGQRGDLIVSIEQSDGVEMGYELMQIMLNHIEAKAAGQGR